MSELVPLSGGVVNLKETGLEWLKKPTLDEYLALGSMLSYAVEAYQWAIGDLLVYGEDNFPGWTQVDVNLRLSESRLKDLRWVAKTIPPARRNPDITFSHHQAIAGKIRDPAEQKKWTDKAAGLSVLELRLQLGNDEGVRARKTRPTLREAVRMAVDYAHPYGDDEWVLADAVYQVLREAIGDPPKEVVEG